MSDRTEFQDNEEISEGRGWLPAWWVWLMYGGFVFALVYGVYMHGIAGWSQTGQYLNEIAEYEKAHPQAVLALTEDGTNPLRGDSAAIERGAKTFQGFCAVCHKVDGTGLVGPNIVDATWLHGGTDRDLFQLVMEGIPADKLLQNPPKGPMPAHKNSLGQKKILEVLAYLASINPNLKEK